MAAPNKNTSVDQGRSLECPVCVSTFRNPKSLRCGHSICLECCQQLRTAFQVVCPVCRTITSVPAEGLPTNFALQALIEHYVTQQKYRCSECKRGHFVEESWICSSCKSDVICSTCVIKNHAGHNLQMVFELTSRRREELTELKRQVESNLENQNQWNARVKKSILEIDARVNEVVEACKRLMQSAMNDVRKADHELASMRHATNALNVNNFNFSTVNDGMQRVVQDVKKKLKDLDELRQGTILRTEAALSSLDVGLHCLSNIGNDDINNHHQEQQTSLRELPKSTTKSPELPPRSATPIFQANFLQNNNNNVDDESIDDERFSTPPRPQRPLAPPMPPLPSAARHAFKDNQHDTTMPVGGGGGPMAASSSIRSMNLDLNQSHFSVGPPPKGVSSPKIQGHHVGYGSVVPHRRGPKSTTGAAGSDFQRFNSNQRYGYRK